MRTFINPSDDHYVNTGTGGNSDTKDDSGSNSDNENDNGYDGYDEAANFRF